MEHKYQDLVLKYKGTESAVLRTNCGIDGDDSAFEVFRGGEQVGANVTSSGVVAVVSKQLVLQLAMHAEKNGGLGDLQQLPPPLELLHQVTVEGVHGVLRRSLDGDFIINHKEPGNGLGTKVEFPFNGEVELSADVVCSTGMFKMFLFEPGAFPFCAFMMLPCFVNQSLFLLLMIHASSHMLFLLDFSCDIEIAFLW